MKQEPQLIEKLVTFDNAPGGDLIIKHEQEIPQEFLDSLHVQRVESMSTPAGTFHKIASIPTSVLDEWALEGFNIYDPNVTAEEIMKRLRLRDLQKFIATNKRI